MQVNVISHWFTWSTDGCFASHCAQHKERARCKGIVDIATVQTVATKRKEQGNHVQVKSEWGWDATSSRGRTMASQAVRKQNAGGQGRSARGGWASHCAIVHSPSRWTGMASPFEKGDDGADGHHGDEKGDAKCSKGQHDCCALR